VNTQEVWSKWLKKLPEILNVRIARSSNLTKTGNQHLQLHVCDASEKAFSTVAYIRIEEKSNIRCHLLFSKPHVAPLKTLTLPRLELQGAVMAVRMQQTIKREFELEFEETHFWTDSMLNLQYLANEHKRFKVFIGNRIAEIYKHSEIDQWHYVPGKLNSADLASRGGCIEEMNEDSHWLTGPLFLSQSEDHWPTAEIPTLDEDNEELRSCQVSAKSQMAKHLYNTIDTHHG